MHYEWGKPGGEGGEKIEAAAVEPPNYMWLEGWAVMGGVIELFTPRFLHSREDNLISRNNLLIYF